MGIRDLFRPGWKHSDPNIRANAIHFLEDHQQDILYTIALEDEEASNRRAAARKISDQKLLQNLSQNGRDRSIRDTSKQRLNQILAERAKSAALEEARGYLKQLTDHKLLAAVATEAREVDVRKLAYGMMRHTSSIVSAVMRENDTALAEIGINKLTSRKHLEQLNRDAANKKIRKLASQKLEKLFPSTQKQNPQSEAKAKVKLLLQQMESLSGSGNLEAVNEQYHDLEQSWNQLLQEGALPSSEEIEQFLKVKQTIQDNKQQLEIKVQQQKRLEEEQEKRLDLAFEICDDLETLANSQELEKFDQVDHLFKKWNTLGELPPAARQDIQSRFERVKGSLLKERPFFQQKRRERNESKTLLLKLCGEAELLATSSKPHRALEIIPDLKEEWNSVMEKADAVEDSKTMETRFLSAIEQAKDVLQKRIDQLAANQNENLKEKESLLPQLEGLVDIPNLVEAEKQMRSLNMKWKELGDVPPQEEDRLEQRYIQAVSRFREAQDWARWSNLRGKTAVCEELESLAGSSEDKLKLANRFKELREKWKSIGPVPWESSEDLWDRYHKICDTLFETFREFFAELEEERESNYQAKVEVCEKIEAMTPPDDWKEATEYIKEIQSNWKAMGAVPRDKAEELWERFRNSCNAFFEARKAFYQQRDEQRQENLKLKMELVEQVEALKDSTAWRETAGQIKDAQEKWKNIGGVPREHSDQIWERFKSACDTFFEARKEFLNRLDAERPMNLAKKEALCEVVEKLDQVEKDEEKVRKIRDAQSEWRKIGPVPQELEKSIWARFRKPIDEFYDARKQRWEEEQKRREENYKVKEQLCIQAEELKDSEEWKSTTARMKELQAEWKKTGPVPRELDKEIWKRFRSACDVFFERLKENVHRMDQQRMENLKKKEDLCFQAEIVAGTEMSEEQQEHRKQWEQERMSEEFKNFLQEPAHWGPHSEKMKAIQREWKDIGPVPREFSDKIWKRFRSACDLFFEKRRDELGDSEEKRNDNLAVKKRLVEEAEALALGMCDQLSRNRIKQMQREWKSTGPVPRDESDQIWKRFKDACDTIFQGGAPTTEEEVA